MNLLAFGEYLPGGDLVPALYRWFPGTGHLAAGTRLRALPLARGAAVLPLI